MLHGSGCPYEIRKMYVAVRVQENIVGFDITVDDALTMYVPQSAPQLSDPEPDGVFRKGLPGDVESKVATAHKINNKVPGVASVSYRSLGTSIRGRGRTCTLYLESYTASCR